MTATEEAQPARRAESVLVRNSRDADVEAMLAIYLHHIRNGVDPSQHHDIEAPDVEDLSAGARTCIGTSCRILWPSAPARWWATPMRCRFGSGRPIAMS